MTPHRKAVTLALILLSVSWSSWICFSSGPLAISEATLEILGDFFNALQQPLTSERSPFATPPRFSLVPMPSTQNPVHPEHTAITDDDASPKTFKNYTPAIFSETYVISLPHRSDRRVDMERVRQIGPQLNWTYFSATPSDDDRVAQIVAHVRHLRHNDTTPAPHAELFSWPAQLAVSSSRELEHLGADLWSISSLEAANAAFPSPLETSGDSSDLDLHSEPQPLTCASRDYTHGPPYNPSLPPYMVLTPSKIACWYSHVQVLRRIAEPHGKTNTTISAEDRAVQDAEVALILEDDIDMERDFHERLGSLWSSLPAQWEMLYLGHCWSNESYHTALSISHPSQPGGHRGSSVHPSRAPKCTHAYAVTRAGARKLVEHLRFVPFAYSRALDQAYAWLILSGRIKSYSVVPSLVVQRKVVASDIDPGNAGVGSPWRESLENGVF